MKNFILFLLLLAAFVLPAQNQLTKWYFGKHAALDFMTNPPTVLNNSAMWAGEGCSSIADASGNLLFYTDGTKVWNSQHAVMANGTGLLGNASSAQSSLILKPNSNNLYYIFTMAANGSTIGLNYSIVDMSLAAGLGSVTVKNAPVYHETCTEMLHATKHANGTDFWVMVREVGNNNNFRAYLVTATGVNTTAVVSSIGTPITGSYIGAPGCMKFSPTGNKIGISQMNLVLAEVYDFNNNTGVVTNSITLNMGGLVITGQAQGLYGCAFSPDGTKFYVNSITYPNSYVFQWDLSAGSNAAVLSSSVAVYSGTNPSFGSMQLAPDNKIYIAKNSLTAYSLAVINNPNAAGSNCNFVLDGQNISAAINATLTSHSTYGLPNMLSGSNFCSIFFGIQGSIVACAGNAYAGNISVNVSGNTGNVSYLWSNGASTYTSSSLNNPSSGQWSVTVADSSGCSASTTFSVSQEAAEPITPSISVNSAAICIGDSVVLNASGANSYAWSANGNVIANTQSISVAPLYNTTYYLTGTGSNGCTGSSIPVTVSVSPPPALSVSGSTIYCSAQIVTLTASGAYNYYWQWGGAHAHASSSTIVLKQGVTTQYTLTGTNEYGCKSVEVVTVTIGCVGIDKFEIGSEKFEVYPNPASQILNVESPPSLKGGIVEIYVYDVLGNVILNEKLNIENNVAQINVSALKSGMYFLKIGNRTQKFVKE